MILKTHFFNVLLNLEWFIFCQNGFLCTFDIRVGISRIKNWNWNSLREQSQLAATDFFIYRYLYSI